MSRALPSCNSSTSSNSSKSGRTEYEKVVVQSGPLEARESGRVEGNGAVRFVLGGVLDTRTNNRL